MTKSETQPSNTNDSIHYINQIKQAIKQQSQIKAEPNQSKAKIKAEKNTGRDKSRVE
jgi:hypothetical protein